MIRAACKTLLTDHRHNWALADPKNPTSEPLIIPRAGELVAVDIMMQTFIDGRINLREYFALKDKVLDK